LLRIAGLRRLPRREAKEVIRWKMIARVVPFESFCVEIEAAVDAGEREEEEACRLHADRCSW
jgi:hypothetical protein